MNSIGDRVNNEQTMTMREASTALLVLDSAQGNLGLQINRILGFRLPNGLTCQES